MKFKHQTKLFFGQFFKMDIIWPYYTDLITSNMFYIFFNGKYQLLVYTFHNWFFNESCTWSVVLLIEIKSSVYFLLRTYNPWQPDHIKSRFKMRRAKKNWSTWPKSIPFLKKKTAVFGPSYFEAKLVKLQNNSSANS